MVRSRFSRLPPEQQRRIVDAAVEEFARHGFHDASLNRVIETAGISKGSMYYYFDGKEDLYAYVARVELERLFADLAPFTVPAGDDADAFWSALAAYYLRLMRALTERPDLAALMRGLAAAASHPALQQAQQELEQAVVPWLERTVSAGQRLRAVRTDLPTGLLIAVVMGMGQAMDLWLMAAQPEAEELPGLTTSLVEMIRRAVEP
jgi:AcrR family transcriptional regulator